MANNEKFFSNRITRCAATNIMLDFRDKLIPAMAEDYAMIHGIGGEDFAPKSTIQCCICDYSKGKGDKSVTVYANLAMDEVEYIRKATEAFYNYKSNYDSQVNSAANKAIMEVGNLQDKMRKFYTQLRKMAIKDKEGNVKTGDFIKAVEKLGANLADIKESITMIPPYNGVFYFSQSRVDTYKLSMRNGVQVAEVRLIEISRQSFMSNGEAKKYPWRIEITNGTAPPIKHGGLTTYDRHELEVQKKASIPVYDKDMFRMFLDISRYISQWESYIGNGFVRYGIEKREENRRLAKQAKNN